MRGDWPQIAVNRIIFTRLRRHVLHKTEKKKNNRIFRYAAQTPPQLPQPPPRRRISIIYNIILPNTLDSFPTRMFSRHRRLTICYDGHYPYRPFGGGFSSLSLSLSPYLYLLFYHFLHTIT